LVNLERLFLHNNQLKSIDAITFKGLIFLKWLYLDSNQIASIDSLTFNELKSLERLYLQNNKLTSIESNTFKSLSSLERLTLFNNNVKSTDTIQKCIQDLNSNNTTSRELLKEQANITFLILESYKIISFKNDASSSGEVCLYKSLIDHDGFSNVLRAVGRCGTFYSCDEYILTSKIINLFYVFHSY